MLVPAPVSTTKKFFNQILMESEHFRGPASFDRPFGLVDRQFLETSFCIHTVNGSLILLLGNCFFLFAVIAGDELIGFPRIAGHMP